MALFEARGITHSFGGLVALDDVTLRVERGQIKGVIGPNGAGKTTLFNISTGVIRSDAGELRFKDKRITGCKPYQIARLGLSRTFQSLSLFLNMSVIENVMIGRHCRTRRGIVSAALRLPAQRREERVIRDDAMRYLDYVGLADLAGLAAASLSFGQRRMVELARAMATEPELLLLDEPASGLNTRETADLADLIRKIRDGGITILLVEHDMSLVMEICDDILVLDFGKPLAEGDPAAVRNNPNVVAVYLGGDFDDASR